MKELSEKQYIELKNINLTDFNIKKFIKNLNDFKELTKVQDKQIAQLSLSDIFKDNKIKLSGGDIKTLFNKWLEKYLPTLNENDEYIIVHQDWGNDIYIYSTSLVYENDKSVIDKIRKNIINRKKEEKLKNDFIKNNSFDKKIEFLNSLLEDKEILKYLEQKEKKC